ncbi:MAG: hypothetical protein S4CHLAM6_05100 [Chlamydiae bacterium]|nr:hypothetical protein [Chlamydiota bacterium]
MLNKKELRKKFSSIVEQMPKDRRLQASEKAFQRLTLLAKEARTVASFAPFGSEIDIWSFNKEMIKSKKLLLPKVSGKDLSFYNVNHLSELAPSQWGILEPSSIKCSPVKVDEIDLFLVPGLAYDKQGQRLGKGKGFYDRFISLHSPKEAIGVGFLEQLFEGSLPVELHDQPLEKVLLF